MISFMLGGGMVAEVQDSPIRVRTGRRADIDAVLPIWEAFMREHEARDEHFRLASNAPERWRSLMTEMIHRDDGFVLVAEVDGDIAGYVLGWLARNPPIYEASTVGFISELAVSETRRHCGVGSHLVRASRDWFNRRGAREFQLATALWNEAARALWESEGARPILVRYRFQ
jgi:ribosomal protein S18 acetylase RimI-like enzyme